MHIKKVIIFLSVLFCLLVFCITDFGQKKNVAQVIKISVQKRIPSDSVKGKTVVVHEEEKWNPLQTAIIICDMWDEHWCKGATERVTELAPAINNVISIARRNGVLIVHAPSECMDYYKDYPGRKMAVKYKLDKNKESLISDQNLVSEKNAKWPIDQSDGGCDDLPKCKERKAWSHETDLIKIKDNDVISDSGDEIGALFYAKGIKNVILLGVHTNMCVIGRTFGLRNMIRLGMNAVLMRDMTDVMYNSKKWPKVPHFKGIVLVTNYIEEYVCPTMLSTDFTGEKPFQFAGNKYYSFQTPIK
jgi:nicotinamidase-related amidase